MPDATAVPFTPPLSPNDVLAIAAAAGRRVLLVGCTDGELGQALLVAGATEVVGLDGCARALARARLTAVLAVDPDAAPELPWPDGYFDLFVFEDLSRLLAPVQTVAHLGRWLADGGRLVCVVPNVFHEAAAAALLTTGRLPPGAGSRPMSVGAALAALAASGFDVEDDVILVRTEAGAAAAQLGSLATVLGADPAQVADGLTLVRAVFGARPRKRVVAGVSAIPDPWRGSRPVKVLVTPDLEQPDDAWADALGAMARAFASTENVTLGVTLPADRLAAPPPALEAAVAGVTCDLVLIEEPADAAGWSRLFAGAGTWVPTSPRPLQLALARGVGVRVQTPGTGMKTPGTLGRDKREALASTPPVSTTAAAAVLPPAFEAHHVLWLRPDAVGDTVISLAMLPHVAKRFAGARLTVVCQEAVAPLYRTCPHVGDVVTFVRARAMQDEAYRADVMARVAQVRADLCLHSVHSRDALGDLLARASGAREVIGFGGDQCNMTPEQHEALDRVYTRLLPAAPDDRNELDRHRAFLRALGCEVEELEPSLWLAPEDDAAAQVILNGIGLPAGQAIAVFPGSTAGSRVYLRMGEALRPFAEAGHPLLVVGSESERALGDEMLRQAGGRGWNLCEGLPLRTTAALLRRCRLAVGVESGLVQLACAVGLPNVVAYGGSFFGRFLPHSALTSCVALPLDCYGCNGRCVHPRAHCVWDLDPAVVTEAVRQALAGRSDRPRLYLQSRWAPPPGGPAHALPVVASVAGRVHLVAVDPTGTAPAAQPRFAASPSPNPTTGGAQCLEPTCSAPCGTRTRSG